MVIWPPPKQPMVFAAVLADGEVIDAGQAATHQATLIELPVFVAVGTEPIAAVIVPLIGESHRDAVVVKSPEFLDQAIIEFAIPFPDQERANGIAAVQELTAVPPTAVGRVSERHAAMRPRRDGPFARRFRP